MVEIHSLAFLAGALHFFLDGQSLAALVSGAPGIAFYWASMLGWAWLAGVAVLLLPAQG